MIHSPASPSTSPAPPRLPPPPPAAPPPPQALPAPPAAEPPPISTRARKIALIAAIIAAVAIAAIAAIVLFRGGAGKPPAALASARLSGPFNIIERVTSTHGYSSLKAGSTDRLTWTFAPVCKSGACTVRVRFTVTSALNPVKGETATIRLVRSGRVYRGVGKAALSSCQLQPVFGPTRIWLRVTRAAWIDGTWTATRVAGALTHSSPRSSFGLWTCNPSAFTARVGGRAVG